MNGTYLWPRKRRSGARHLAIGAHPNGDPWRVRTVPLCGQDRGRNWLITGTWSENWPTAKDSPLCTRCLNMLAQLNEEAKQ